MASKIGCGTIWGLALLMLIHPHSLESARAYSRKKLETYAVDLTSPPWEISGNATNDFVRVSISQFRIAVSDAEMSFEAHQAWYDPRHVNTSAEPNSYIIVPAADFHTIWSPDTFVINQLPNGVYEATPSDFIQIFPNGSLAKTTRHSMLFHCNVLLFEIPTVDEVCWVKMASGSYAEDVLRLYWANVDPVILTSDFVSFVVDIKRTIATTCEYEQYGEPKSCLELQLHVRRKYNVYHVQIYLPSTLIVFITWLGFWIHHTEVSGRTRIITVSFTAMIAQFIATILMNPDQLHMDAVIWWNSGCIILITLALVEYIIAHRMHLREARNVKQTPSDENAQVQSKWQDLDDTEKQLQEKPRQKRRKVFAMCTKVEPFNPENDCDKTELDYPTTTEAVKGSRAECIDCISRVLFVILFAVFNFCYWGYFLGIATR